MKLPETWIQTKLGVVLQRVDDKFDPRIHPGVHNGFIGLENIESHTGQLAKGEVESKNETEILSLKTRFRVKDVLYGRLRPYLNKVYLAEKEGICSTEIWALRATPDILPEFAAYYLRSAPVCEKASQIAVGANLPRVPPVSFDRIPVSLPTLPEQQRIVEVLRQAEGVENLRAQQARDVTRIACERFYDLFGHPAENARGFEVVSLTGLGDFDRGVSKHRPRDAAHLFGGPYPFIQTGDVTNAGDWITSYSTTYSEAGLAQSLLWSKGTLCITIAANIARAAILDFDACFPDSVVGFTPHTGVHTEYVLYCLRFYQEFFEHRASKSAQMNINLEKLRALRVPKPPEPLQRKFAEFVRAIREVTDLLEPQRQEMISVRQQLQLAAFSGELTEKWREQHQDETEQAASERRPNFVGGGKRVSVAFIEHAPQERNSLLARPSRTWLVEQLSQFQNNVRSALYEWKGTVIPDDTEAFDDFCRQWPIEHEQNPKDRVRRTLEQLAALGVVAKVSLRNDSGKFVTGFRPLREDENTRLVDAERIMAELARRSAGEGNKNP